MKRYAEITERLKNMVRFCDWKEKKKNLLWMCVCDHFKNLYNNNNKKKKIPQLAKILCENPHL